MTAEVGRSSQGLTNTITMTAYITTLVSVIISHKLPPQTSSPPSPVLHLDSLFHKMPASNAFILGATGFVGRHTLSALARATPNLHLHCLMRNATVQRIAVLENLNSNVEVVEGTLEDSTLITSEAAKADIVINVASSDHMASVVAILAGLRAQVERNVERSPIYLHMSGLGIIADNVRGEKVDAVKEWTDLDLDLEQ
jgi:hypothetical protein